MHNYILFDVLINIIFLKLLSYFLINILSNDKHMILKKILTNQDPLSRKTYYLLQLNYIDILFNQFNISK